MPQSPISYVHAGSSSEDDGFEHSPRNMGTTTYKLKNLNLSPEEKKQRLERKRWNRYMRKLKAE
jgi:hypothetical protein